MSFNINDNRNNGKTYKFGWILFLSGFFSFSNGIFYRLGGISIRLSDLFFYICTALLLFTFRTIKIRRSEFLYLYLILFLCIILILKGIFPLVESLQYDRYFNRFFLNRILWLPLYVLIFLVFRNGLLRYFSLGLVLGLLFNSFFVLYEYIVIVYGEIPDYVRLSSLGIYFDEKKFDIFNQGFIRPTGFMMDPNYTAAYSGLGILFAEKLKLNSKYSSIYNIGQTILLVVMFLLLSRTAIFSFFIVVVIFIFIGLKTGFDTGHYTQVTLARLPLLLLSILLIVASFGVAKNGIDVFALLGDRFVSNDSSATTRLLYFEDYFTNVPILLILFGFGTSRAGAGYDKYVNGLVQTEEVWSPESSILTFMFEQGLFFVVFYFILSVFFFFRILKFDRYHASVFMYINLIGISYNFLGDRLFWFLYTVLILSIPTNCKYENID